MPLPDCRNPRTHARLKLLAAALSALPVAAHADEASPPQIVVTGTGLPDTPAAPAYDLQTIARDRLTATASGRIEDALSSVAGFQQFRRSDSRAANPSAQGVTLRALGGNASSRTLVLLDGVPMADPFFGSIPLSAIAPERLASARVTRGGGSGAFGAGAVAGTIDLASADAAQLGLLGASALVDDRGETELSGTFAPTIGSGFAVVSGRWDRGQGFWTTPSSQRVPLSVKSKYDSWSVGIRGVAPLTDTIELQARGLGFSDHRTLRFAGADSTSSGEDASLRVVGHGPWQFDVLGYIQARNFTNIVISSTSFKKTLDQHATPSTGVGGKIELRPPVGGGHVLRLGADWRNASGEGREDAYNPATGAITARRAAGGRNGDVGLFVQDDWTFGALVLTAGARADRWTISAGHLRTTTAAGVVTGDVAYPDRAGWQGSFRGGAVLTPLPGLSLRASAYTGMRQPTLNELYRTFALAATGAGSKTVITTTTRANAALRNERLRGFEAGVDVKPFPALTLSATAFDNKVLDAIANVTLASTATTITRQRFNVDAIRARGLEFGAALRVGRVGLDGSLALTDAKVEASGASAALDGKRPAQTPKIAMSATLSWHPRDDWTLAATLRHTGLQYEDDLQVDSLPPATTIDAYLEVPVAGPFAIVLRGENLTGADIVTRNQGGSIDLGTPRTLWAGIKVRVR
ncbi:TonB-dependent receptor [Novosphingobium lentum]|uniref:TonB-dependent receptor n=1 Tax=Novosphingobium lentum TaxID=145287 RepID=UPI000832E7B2|nr:TonB-dependent receptor [Novosphingobium lentum]